MNMRFSLDRIVLFVFAFSYMTFSFASSYEEKSKKRIDSLTFLLTKIESDTNKVKILNKLAWEYRYSNADMAKNYVDQAFQLSDRIGFQKGKASALSNKGKIAEYEENFPSALEQYKISINLRKDMGDQKGIAISYFNIGNVYYLMGKDKIALNFYYKSLKIRKKINDHKGIIRTCNIMLRVYTDLSLNDSVISVYHELLKVHIARKDKKAETDIYNEIGANLYFQEKYAQALRYYNKSLSVAEDLKDKVAIINSLKNIGLIHSNQSNYNKALEYYKKVLVIEKEIKDIKGMIKTLTNIGQLQTDMGNNDQALKTHRQALSLNKNILDTVGLADAFNNIGEMHYKSGMVDSALFYYFKSLEYRESIQDVRGMANAYNNIGAIYFQQGEFNKANELQLKALDIQNNIHDQQGKVFTLNALGNIYLSEKKYSESEEYFDECLKISKNNDFLSDLRDAYQGLSSVLAKKGNMKKAFKYQKQFMLLKDSIINMQKSKELTELEAKMELTRQEAKAQEEKLIQDLKYQSEIQQQRYFTLGALLIILVVIVIAILLYNQNKLRRKNNIELSKRNDIIANKNEKITSSINYAKRIQDAILPKEQGKDIFPESIVLYKPKDIVSGDFYWMAKRKNKKLFAAIDCTGHGVPGAFMSMIGNALFNEVIYNKGILNPAEILNEVRDGVVKSLKQKGETGGQKDGMDAALCVLDTENNELEFSGAHNPLYILRKVKNGSLKIDGENIENVVEENGNILYEIRGDLQPLGYHRVQKDFTKHKIKVLSGDRLFIFTDGYADQFGGKQGKKFKYSRLKALLLKSFEETLPDQHKAIEATFNRWKGEYAQLDDVCIVGVSIT